MMSTRNFYNAMTPGSSLNPGPNNKKNKEQRNKLSSIKTPIQVPLRSKKVLIKPLNSDMMVGKSAFKQIQDKEINSKYPILEKKKLFNAGHFDHFGSFLSFLTLAPALCPTGSSRIQTDCQSTVGLCSTP